MLPSSIDNAYVHLHVPACLPACCFQGVVYTGREDLSEPDNYLSEVAVDTPLRTLKEAVAGADVFLGLSVSWGVKSSVNFI